MRWHRLLSPDLIRMELEFRPAGESEDSPRAPQEGKEAILQELVDLLSLSGKISNSKKLFLDMRNRERKATTGIGSGVAVPHVRTRQAREFVMALARAPEGVDFDAIDGGKVFLFLAMVSPPYEDRQYLRVYQKIGKIFSQEEILERILNSPTEHEIIRILAESS